MSVVHPTPDVRGDHMELCSLAKIGRSGIGGVRPLSDHCGHLRLLAIGIFRGPQHSFEADEYAIDLHIEFPA